MACVEFAACAGDVISSPVFRNISFLFGVLVAIVSVLSARATAKKKQSADLLSSTRSDEELVTGLRCLSSLHNRADANNRQYANDAQADTDEAKCIRYVLNHYEYVAVGLQSGIYDETMLRRASHNTVVSLFTHARPFIEALREHKNRPSLYQEMQCMAERWQELGQPKKLKKPFWAIWR